MTDLPSDDERRIRADQTRLIVEWLRRYADEHGNPQALWFGAAIAQEFGDD